MTFAAARTAIAITSVGVPEELAGVPLSIEIVSPGGTVRRSRLVLQDGRRQTEPVDEPGRYLVRVALPSGDSLAETATVPEPAAGKSVVGAVTLDFGGAARPRRAATLDSRDRGAGHRGVDLERGLVPGFSLESALGLSGHSSGATLTCGFFRQWNGSPQTGNILVMEGRTETSISLPGDLALARHPGWAPSTTAWRPLLVCVDDETLVVWPPSSDNRPLHLEEDPSPGTDPAVPPLLASSPSEDKVVAALFAYGRGGRVEDVREQAEHLLGVKSDNPVNATLAAYTLQKIGAEHPEWLFNLANDFPHLPDGALLYGWHLIRDDKTQEARPYFLTALERGIPMYSEGIRLLRNGLSFLHGLGSGDSGLEAAMTRAYRLADAVNPHSVLTCLRLGSGLDILWV